VKKKTLPIDQAGLEWPCHCAACLNLTANLVAATRIVGGYLLCDEHAELADDEFAQIIWHGKKPPA
jgi:hypothetical protein